jgi:hypothetical protein
MTSKTGLGKSQDNDVSRGSAQPEGPNHVGGAASCIQSWLGQALFHECVSAIQETTGLREGKQLGNQRARLRRSSFAVFGLNLSSRTMDVKTLHCKKPFSRFSMLLEAA